jgi:hypothetical protein
MSTWRPPWSAPGQFKLTLLPPTRASNSVTARQAPGPGSTASLRTGSPGPCTPRPARRSGLAGRVPARQPTTRRPRRGRALRATPSQPSRNRIDQHDTSGGLGQASSDPTRPQRADRRGMTRPSSVCPAWVGEQSKHGCAERHWQTPRRRRRTDGAGLRRHPNLRRGWLQRPAVPVQPRSVLRDPPRLGPAGGDSAAHPPVRPRSWVTAQVGCWVSWPAGWSWLDRWEERRCYLST